MKALIFDIERNSYVDGPGIRTTVFFKGCNLRCKWCHNPESQSMQKEILFYKDKCKGCGRCKDLTVEDTNFVCYNDAKEICGREYTVEEAFDIVIKDKEFYDNSGGGVTVSGGECMLQIDFVLDFLKKCKNAGIHTAVDTAGSVPWEYFEKIMPYTDLFLYDVKCISENLHIEGTGASNRLILLNLKRLSEHFDGEIIIRIPVIPGFNATIDEMNSIAEFLRNIRYKKVELLPYHKLGEHKYYALGMQAKMYDVPTQEVMSKYKKIFDKL